jgi:hypothetical protein
MVLEEVNKYFSLVTSSLLLVKIISVTKTRMDSDFLVFFLLLAVFKANLILFMLFKFGDCATISRVVVVLVTVVTPHVGPLMSLR